MKPIEIKKVLDLAWTARTQGSTFYPLFRGDSGLGKSAIIREWCAEMAEKEGEFHFIDLRLAYLEKVDFVGFPIVTTSKDGRQTTKFATPDLFPTTGKGLLILEEINRADDSCTNSCMELLQEGTIGKYAFPKTWLICSSINPDIQGMSVNALDTALANRFIKFEVDYDHSSFIAYMKNMSFDADIIRFIEGGKWVYVKSDALPNDRIYISPRNIEQLNSARKAGLANNPMMHLDVSIAILGQFYGKMFHEFCFAESPVTMQDIIKNRKTAMSRLKKYSKSKEAYHGDMITITCNDAVNAFNVEIEDGKDTIGEKTIADIIGIIPADQGVHLMGRIRLIQFEKDKRFKNAANKAKELSKYWQTTYPEQMKNMTISKKDIE